MHLCGYEMVRCVCMLVLLCQAAASTCKDTVSGADGMGDGGFIQAAVSTNQLLLQNQVQAKQTAWAATSAKERICGGPDAVEGALASLGLDSKLPSFAAERIGLFCTKAVTRKNEPGLDWLHDPQHGGSTGNLLQPNVSKDMIQLSGGALHAMSVSADTYMGNHGVGLGGWQNTHTDLVVDTFDTVVGIIVDILDLSGVAPVAGASLSLVASVVSYIIRIFLWQFAEPEPTVGELINSALAKERMRANTDFWVGMADELETFPGLFSGATEYSEAKTAWLLVLQHDLAANKATVFMRECLSNETWDSDICTQYIKDGMWEVMLPYAQVHFAVLTELQMQFLENPLHDISHRKIQVELLVARTKEVGHEYVAALEHAWEVYSQYRKEALWNPFEEGFYGDWDYYQYEVSNYHPFDFIHARVGKGYNKLNVEFPLEDRKGTHSDDVNKIRNWGYEGCEGERHNDVTKDRNPVEVNHACNLFQMITDPEGSEQCRCNSAFDSGKWYQTQLSDSDKQCWARCMNEYQEVQLGSLEETFKNKVQSLKEMVHKLEDYKPTLKIALQRVGTLCNSESRLLTSKCEEAMEIAGFNKTSIEPVMDEHRPGGCSVTGDGTLLINEVETGTASPEYSPLCAALFYSTSEESVSPPEDP